MPVPFASQAQRRLFYAAASGKATKATGLSKREARKAIKENEDVRGLPERVRKKRRM